MTLTVEDGTRPAGANSYETVANADTFLALMGNTAWEDLEAAEKEACMVQGALIVNDGATYRYDGSRQTLAQEMAWPRTGARYWQSGPAISDDTIPPEVKRANIVAAGGIANGTIKPSGGATASSNVKSETVDVLSVSYFSPKEMALDGMASGRGPYSGLGWPDVTGILAPLLDADWYGDTLSGGLTAADAARRGPSFKPPSYGGIWDVGQNDS